MSKPKSMPSYWTLAEEVTHLHGQLDKLEAENAKLREQLEYAMQTSRARLETIDRLKAENAKLRKENDTFCRRIDELCADMWNELDAATQHDAGGGRGIVYEFADRMRELGIEVKE